MDQQVTQDPGFRAGSRYLDRQAAERAVRMALPLIESAMGDVEVCGSGFLYIVICDPARAPGSGSFEQAVLYEHSIGDRSRWDADYAAFARAKARLSWEHGVDSHVLQSLRPHLLRRGDTTLRGSAVIDGIVVGVSGAYPWFDEAFAGVLALCLKAIAQDAAQKRPAQALFVD